MSLAKKFGIATIVLAAAGIGGRILSDVQKSGPLLDAYAQAAACDQKQSLLNIGAQGNKDCSTDELKGVTIASANDGLKGTGNGLIGLGLLTGAIGLISHRGERKRQEKKLLAPPDAW